MMSCANIVVLRHIAKLSLSCLEKKYGTTLPIVRSYIGKLRRFYEKAGENPRKIGRFLSCVRVGAKKCRGG